MSRFMRRGIAVVRFSPTLTSANLAPSARTVTRAEITASVNLTGSIAELSGWQLEGSTIPVPDMGSRFAKNIPGERSASDSAITFYEDDLTNTVETALSLDVAGFIWTLRKGDKPSSPSLDIFPVRVRSRSPEFSAGNDPARFVVQFAITDEPTLDSVVPA